MIRLFLAASALMLATPASERYFRLLPSNQRRTTTCGYGHATADSAPSPGSSSVPPACPYVCSSFIVHRYASPVVHSPIIRYAGRGLQSPLTTL